MIVEKSEKEVKRNIFITSKGRLIKRVCEVYQRDDIGCSWPSCSICINPTYYLSNENSNNIFVIDYALLSRYFDCLSNSKVTNFVINQSSTELLMKENLNTYKRLKNSAELEKWRAIYVFPNKFSKSTYLPNNVYESEAQHETRLVAKTFEFYAEHLRGQANVCLLSNNPEFKSKYANCFTIVEFVQNFASNKEELEDFLGFDDSLDIELIKGVPALAYSYPELIGSDLLFDKVAKGLALKGKIRYNRLNNEEASVFSPVLNRDILVKGLTDLNRSFNGDVVVVELLDPSEWTKITTMKLEDDVFEEEQREEEVSAPASEFQQLKKLLEQEDIIPRGKVIGIFKRNLRNFAGEVSEVLADNICCVTLTDSRYPKVCIKSTRVSNLLNKKIIINIRDWPSYSKYPLGNLIRIVGDAGDNTVENDVILFEFNVETKDFSKRVMDCLPAAGEEWRIPESEYKKRWDLRDEFICSVDPPGCRDIDDALHSKLLPNGNLEIGVHIADVTYFVRPDTPIDLEAANRCTTVYLVDRRTDMLPKLLTECLCSLMSNVERLAFSVIWEIDPNSGNTINTRFGKSVIKSKRAFTYQEAQNVIDDTKDNSPLAMSLRRLLHVAKILKEERLKAGALQLASTQVKFKMGEEDNNPTDVTYYDIIPTNSMVEEFMLLANVAVGKKIVDNFPASGILRRHSSPKPEMIKQLSKILALLGYDLDYSTSKTLAESLDYIQRQNDPFFNKLVRIMTTRCMHEAVYFCSAEFDKMEYKHYGLAADIYTHFTSPIRRYADVLVHRLLSASIDIESLPTSMCNKQALINQCLRMNMRNRNARNASRASSEFFSYLFFRNKTLTEEGIISSIQNNGFTVVVAKYGFEGFIEFDEKDVLDNLRLAKEDKEKTMLVNFSYRGRVYKLFDWVNTKIEVQLVNYRKSVLIEII